MLDALASSSAAASPRETDSPSGDNVLPMALLRDTDVIVDVGSGVGKFVLAVALLSPSARAVGLEIVRERHLRATQALSDAKASGLLLDHEASRVRFALGDATQTGILPADTTLAFLSNLCFSSDLNRRLLQALLRLPKLRCIASLRKLEIEPVGVAGAHAPPDYSPDEPPSCGRIELVRSLRVSMSWDDRTRLYVYCCR